MSLPLPRRDTLMPLAASGAALATRAVALPMVDEMDARPAALGDVAEAQRADVKMHPKIEASARLHRLRELSGQGRRQAGRLPALRRQAACGNRQVRRLGDEGVNTLAGREASR